MKRLYVAPNRRVWAWKTEIGAQTVIEEGANSKGPVLDWLRVMTKEPVALCESAEAPRDEAQAVDLRTLFDVLPPEEYAIAAEAIPVYEWRRTSRFCGACGEALIRDMGERCMVCPSCKNRVYPRLNPAVITCITRKNGEEVLLARRAQSLTGFYSVIAGFVEAGESLEHAVKREVREEVGIGVCRLRYFGSQGWPFPNSLMVGFMSEWEEGEIQPDGTEIAEAGWYRRDALPILPGKVSIARRMIEAWKTGRVPRPAKP